MNVYDFFSDSAKKTHEASIPDEKVASLVDKVNEHGEKLNRITLEDNGALTTADINITDKAKVKSLEVNDSLHISGGRLYIASRHPEETSGPSSTIELHEQHVVINPEEWDDLEKNMGTEAEPVNAVCLMAPFETDGFKLEDVIDINVYNVEDIDPNNCTYMAHADFEALFDQVRVTLLPAEDEFKAGKEYVVKRPTGRIAFTVRYVR